MLLESELFGHEKGAFTGAVARRLGRFEKADGGTLFLDEIAELEVDLQAKLLRVLQTGQFDRVGGETSLRADVRVIAATNRDLTARIAAGKFREDLLYRLNVVTVELPPLRQRRDDIPLIADHIVRRLAKKYAWPHLTLTPEAIVRLSEQLWPGNVRELQNLLARAAILARGGVIGADDLAPPAQAGTPPPATGSLLLRDILAETERRVIRQALEQEKWNRTQAARVLGISRRQLFDKVRQYGLSQHEP
jgi:DNA-binding NtrC family response regulator